MFYEKNPQFSTQELVEIRFLIFLQARCHLAINILVIVQNSMENQRIIYVAAPANCILMMVSVVMKFFPSDIIYILKMNLDQN